MGDDIRHLELLTLLDEMPQRARHDVEVLTARATGYVWGWQDAGGEPHDTGRGTRFGIAYGLHAARFATEQISCRRNIRDAWQSWTAGRSIEDHR
jgi:hypothetical protein